MKGNESLIGKIFFANILFCCRGKMRVKTIACCSIGPMNFLASWILLFATQLRTQYVRQFVDPAMLVLVALRCNDVFFSFKIWPECTDPLKYVYEDIAIACYLIVSSRSMSVGPVEAAIVTMLVTEFRASPIMLL